MTSEVALQFEAAPRWRGKGLPGWREVAAPATPDCWTLVLTIAVGTVLVTLAYYLGRHDVRGATAAYWFGQALILVPTALANISRSADTRARLGSLVATAAAQSFLTWAYSPDQFRAGDELLHVVTAQNLLATHHLYTQNLTLTVSPAFPGLEIVAVALVHLTGLSLFHAGVIVASACHIVVPIALFLFFLEVTGRTRLAGLAAFVYTLAPHYSYYDTLFVYGAPGTAFVVLALWAAARTWRRGANPIWIVVAFAPLVVTHHASAAAGLALLAAFAVTISLAGHPRRGLLLVLMMVLLADDFVGWIEIHAAYTFSYLWAPIQSSFLHHGTASHAAIPSADAAPLWEHYMAELAALATTLLILGGIWRAWRFDRSRVPRFFSLLGLAYVGVLFIRLASADGTELAGRALSYAMVVVSLPVAIALAWLWDRARSARGRVLAVGAVAVLLLGQIVTGLPSARQRIPGHSPIDARVTSLSNWAAASWRRYRIAVCPTSVCKQMLSVYPEAQTPAYGAVYRMRALHANVYLHDLKISYVVTDAGTTRGSLPTITFDNDPMVDRVYDDGKVRVYYTGRTW